MLSAILKPFLKHLRVDTLECNDIVVRAKSAFHYPDITFLTADGRGMMRIGAHEKMKKNGRDRVDNQGFVYMGQADGSWGAPLLSFEWGDEDHKIVSISDQALVLARTGAQIVIQDDKRKFHKLDLSDISAPTLVPIPEGLRVRDTFYEDEL